jgi:predicted glutamine amidotransferase
LKNLGASNRDGWGIAYYNDTTDEPVVIRGGMPANEDPVFDEAVNETCRRKPELAMGHVRSASSGLTNIPDPHPFKRSKGGKWWLFAHNGGIDKTALIELIGNEYLSQNPPQIGNTTNEWIDSELYFIYVLKCIENQNWNVTKGIAEATLSICARTSATLNFLLTDGEKLWGFRKGYALYYSYTASYENVSQITEIASQYPNSTQGNWALLSDYDLVEASDNSQPSISDVHTIIPEYPTSTTTAVTFLLPSLIILIIVTLVRRKKRPVLHAQEHGANRRPATYAPHTGQTCQS